MGPYGWRQHLGLEELHTRVDVLLMEEVLPSPTWQDSARQAMGQVRRWAERVYLTGMKPSAGVAATGYCFAERRREYLVFQHDKAEFTLDLKDAPARFQAQ